jgi:hypothetical protein
MTDMTQDILAGYDGRPSRTSPISGRESQVDRKESVQDTARDKHLTAALLARQLHADALLNDAQALLNGDAGTVVTG